MKMHSSKPIFKQKRIWLAVGVVVFIAAIVGMWILAGMQLNAVNEQVDAAYSEAKVTSQSVLAGSKVSQQKRLAAVEQLAGTTTPEDCGGEWWSAWYLALPAAKKTAQQCMAKVERLRLVAQAATELKMYLDDDLKVAKTLTTLKMSTGSDTWQKTAQGSAETVLRELENMSETKSNQELLTVSKDKTKLVIDGWVVFNEASSKEDKAAYLDAESKLSQAYANLGVISDVSDKQVIKLVGSVQASISKL